MPDGSFLRFRIEHSLVVEHGLLVKFPELGATYRGHGIDDPTATARFDFLPSGFHSMILSTNGTVIVDPYVNGDSDNYISYFKHDSVFTGEFKCHFGEDTVDSIFKPTKFGPGDFLPDSSGPEVTSGLQMRTYRLALAGDFEYCSAVGGGTLTGCLAAEVLIMNRVNSVYERDVAIHMNIIANNNLITYAADNLVCPAQPTPTACTAANDPYSNSDPSTLLTQNQANVDKVIGNANYDIGHVFTTGGGGLAAMAPCAAGSKAQAETGLSNPLGDAFAIDYVAHEMGHQFGADHTFNGTTDSCDGNRSSGGAYEPGSGITIMAYAGICGAQDLADHSIDTFHVKSLEEIVDFKETGGVCGPATATGNTPPSVSVVGGPAFNIPKQTPFTLTATGSDVNGDAITYDWEEYDLGPASPPDNDFDGQARPLFRPFLPLTSPSRTYPTLTYILNNSNAPPETTAGFLTGEILPSIARTMTFKVVARDNRVNGGGINSATATVVVAATGPFGVTQPNTAVTWAPGSQTVTWNVASTNGAPVNAANVKISLSTDGGLTFATVLAASTPNDGIENVSVPNVLTSLARMKIEAVDNIFFDISDVNFTITGIASVFRAPFDYDGDDRTDLSIFRPAPGEWWYQKSSTGGNAAAQFGSSTDKIVPADFTGDQKTDFAFWRPATGQWFILRSEDFSFFAFPFGASTDIPVPGDYDGDAKADAAVFRPSTNTWFIQKSGGGTDIIEFGASGDKPVVGDYDGDGKADIAIFRPAAGQWWIRPSSGVPVFAVTFGTSTDKLVQGYYTADNKTDMAFWRPATGEWFILRSENSTFFAFPFGVSTDIPVPGDYDGDDRFDAAVFRPSDRNWYIQRSTAGLFIQAFGIAGDIATPNAYVP